MYSNHQLQENIGIENLEKVEVGGGGTGAYRRLQIPPSTEKIISIR
jgi:hypothetical protein